MKSRKILLRALPPQIAAAGYCSELQTCLDTHGVSAHRAVAIGLQAADGDRHHGCGDCPDPRGFAAMLDSIIQYDTMPDLPMVRREKS